MRIKNYQDSIAWQCARELERRVFAFTASAPANRDFEFCDQIRRSAASAPRNIAEGFGRFWPAEFAHKLHIALGELQETQDHLEKALEQKFITDTDHLEMFGLADRAIGAAIRLIAYLEAVGPDWKKQFLTRRREQYRARRKMRTSDPPGKPGPNNAEPAPPSDESQNENVNPNQNQNQNQNTNENENENENENPEP